MASTPLFDVLKGAKKPIVLVGAGSLSRHDGAAVLALAAKIATGTGALKDGWNGFAVLHDTASRVGALDIASERSRRPDAGANDDVRHDGRAVPARRG